MSEEVEGQVAAGESDATSRDFVVESDVTSQERPEWLPEKYNSGED